MMTSSNGTIFRVTGPLCGEFTGHKGQWRGALMFSLICVWIHDWVNNGEAGDLRRHRGHYDVTVMHHDSCTTILTSLCLWHYVNYVALQPLISMFDGNRNVGNAPVSLLLACSSSRGNKVPYTQAWIKSRWVHQIFQLILSLHKPIHIIFIKNRIIFHLIPSLISLHFNDHLITFYLISTHLSHLLGIQ